MSSNESPDAFLESLSMRAPDIATIVDTLRALVKAELGTGVERVRYGGLMFGREHIGVFPRKRHVTVEFGNGVAMNDPYNLLAGTGRSRRHIAVATTEEIETKHLAEYLHESQRLESGGGP